MPVKTSNGTGGGNWSVGSTWAGGVVPVSGTDTVVIAAGDTVTLDSAACTAGSLTVGTDPGTGGTAAITIGATAQSTATALIVNAGLTLRLRGDLIQNGGQNSPFATSSLTLAAGASLIFDPPSTGTYVWKLWYAAPVICNGSSGSRCIVKADLATAGIPDISFSVR